MQRSCLHFPQSATVSTGLPVYEIRSDFRILDGCPTRSRGVALVDRWAGQCIANTDAQH